MRNKWILNLFVFSITLFYACNPDCESTLRISATVTPVGNQVLVATSPPEFLKNGPLYASSTLIVDEESKVASPADFNDAEGGYLITLPSSFLPAATNFFIRDEDCGGFIPINTIFTCETATNFTAEITPNMRLLRPNVETEVLISTTPGNFLEGKKIFIEKASAGSRIITEADASYMAAAGGSIVTIPSDGAAGMTTFFVENTDCGGFIPLNSAFIADESFEANNPYLFLTPAPPLITIPTVNTASIPNVVKTWFSVQDPDYCIWIVPEESDKLDANGEPIELPTLLPGIPDSFKVGGRIAGTREISVNVLGWCGKEPTLAQYAYHLNPISGIVDRESGYVRLAIDRRSKGGEIERYEGMLVDPQSIQHEAYRRGEGTCSKPGEGAEKKIMMVLTHEKTGQQLILYRHA